MGDDAEGLDAAAAAIAAMAPHYFGVYLYVLRGKELEVAGYSGRESPHTRIAVGTGICGTAVATGRDIIVPDVDADPRYLACNAETRSEMVVLVRDGDVIVGQIDIDSDTADAFDDEDLARLREIARTLAPLMARVRAYMMRRSTS